MLTCREIADFLMSYLDHELDAIQLREFEHHLELCPPCVSYLESYKATGALSKKAFAAEPEKMPEELVKSILAARKPPTSAS